MSFCVAGAVLDDIRKCLKNRQSSFSVSAAILLQCFHDLWQAQHFGDVQHFGRIVLRAFCGSHCQGCVKWWPRGNSVGRGTSWKCRLVKIRRVWNVILSGRGGIWNTFVIAIAAFRNATAARGAILPSSFVPFWVAGAVLGDVTTWHSRLDPPLLHCTCHTLHFTLYTPHFTLNPYTTLYNPHTTLYTPHFTLYIPHSTL